VAVLVQSKLKANNIKSKIKQICKEIDNGKFANSSLEKSGTIKQPVFINLLSCSNINLNPMEMKILESKYLKKGYYDYQEVMDLIKPDL
jgi:ketol-acid reductoisomerase